MRITVGSGRLAIAGIACLMIWFSPSALAQRNLEVQQTRVSEQRIALVIGNSAYQRGPLRNPVNDARAVADKLERLGFKVIKRENLKAREIGPALTEFRSRLSAGAVALFFYAGHGLQLKGQNYLPTVDAVIDSDHDVPTQSLNVAQVLELMEEAKTRVNLVFLDACRDNPFARKFRSASRGLAKVDAASGTLIAFATRPGSVAADGDGKNGLYTEHLLKHMDMPGLPIEQVLKRVGAAVKLASKGTQEPWSEGLIEGEFFFRAGPATTVAAASPAPAVDSAAIELAFWESIKTSANPEDFKSYLEQYPNGRFARIARNRLKVGAPAAAYPAKPAAHNNRAREPLEDFPLESIQMLGTVPQGNELYALVKAGPNLYRVKKGNYMGQNFGVITSIDEDQISLKEQVKDRRGVWVDRSVSVKSAEAKR